MISSVIYCKKNIGIFQCLYGKRYQLTEKRKMSSKARTRCSASLAIRNRIFSTIGDKHVNY